MKRICVCFLVCVCLAVSLTGCYTSNYENTDELKQTYSDNAELFLAAAVEALGHGESVFISTYEYFRPEGAAEDLDGLYVHDTLTGETRPLFSETIEKLLSSCGVNSLGVKTEEEISICEFNMGGGRQYYNGIYYAIPDRALFLNNFSIPLEADGDGYSYSVNNMNYYTERWDEHFYYYVAKTK